MNYLKWFSQKSRDKEIISLMTASSEINLERQQIAGQVSKLEDTPPASYK